MLSFEDKFNYLESVIETRIESIILELHEQAENLIHRVDLIEKRFKKEKKITKNCFKINKNKLKKAFLKANIGAFYNEFEKKFELSLNR